MLSYAQSDESSAVLGVSVIGVDEIGGLEPEPGGLEQPVGVMVTSIYPDGPAARAGLGVGDVIVAVADKEIANVQDLRFRIATQPVGGAVQVKVMRRGGVVTLPLAMEAPPETASRKIT